jgi:hypothetical protein
MIIWEPGAVFSIPVEPAPRLQFTVKAILGDSK